MASNRDRLRNMSKKNTIAAKQLIDTPVPTLISDMAEREEANTESSAEEIISSNDKSFTETNNIENIEKDNKINESTSTVIEVPEKKNNEDIKISSEIHENNHQEEITQVEQLLEESPKKVNDATEVEKIPAESAIQEENTTNLESDDSNSQEEKQNISLEEKYQGEEIVISLLLQSETNNYLTYKAMDLRISAKQLLRNLLIKELEQGYIEDDLCPLYRRVQHQTVKRAIVINKKLKEDIQETAIKYRMKYTAFISYILYKAYINDSEYKELM